jgi:hypothetical protein
MVYMTFKYGPSMYWHGKGFTAKYGTQRELLANIEKVIK